MQTMHIAENAVISKSGPALMGNTKFRKTTFADRLQRNGGPDFASILLFVIGDDFHEAALNVANNRDAIMKVRPFARAPFPVCWFERTGEGLSPKGEPVWFSWGALIREAVDKTGFVANIFQESFRGTGRWGVLGVVQVSYLPLSLTPDGWGVTLRSYREDVRQALDWDANYLIRALALLKTKNVAETEYVERASGKVHKLLGRPRFSYTVCKIQARLKKFFCSHGREREDLGAHFVRGHFKHRRTGVFWWSPFMRGDLKNGFADRDYAL